MALKIPHFPFPAVSVYASLVVILSFLMLNSLIFQHNGLLTSFDERLIFIKRPNLWFFLLLSFKFNLSKLSWKTCMYAKQRKTKCFEASLEAVNLFWPDVTSLKYLLNSILPGLMLYIFLIMVKLKIDQGCGTKIQHLPSTVIM